LGRHSNTTPDERWCLKGALKEKHYHDTPYPEISHPAPVDVNVTLAIMHSFVSATDFVSKPSL
jgi:hypothetical protein